MVQTQLERSLITYTNREGVAQAANQGAGGTTEIANRATELNGKAIDVRAQVLRTKESANRLKHEIARFKINPSPTSNN